MIKINLLPQDLQLKYRRVKIDSKSLLCLIPLGFCILIITHIYLGVINIAGNYQFDALNNKWKKLEPQRKLIESISKEYNLLSQDAKLIQEFTKQRISWAQNLNLLSIKLPAGVWFNEILVSNKEFILKGSVVSLVKQELNLINKFLSNLKDDNNFFKNFDKLELGPLQTRTIGGYDIIDFTLVGVLK